MKWGGQHHHEGQWAGRHSPHRSALLPRCVMNEAQDKSTIEILSSAECYRALTSHSIGRVGVIVDHYPLVIPVNYAVDRDAVLIRTAPDSVLSHADRSPVTLEVDDFDTANKSGWSVLLRGVGIRVDPDDPAEILGADAAPGPTPWAPGERPLMIRIRATGISGRRIVRGAVLEWRLTSMAYLWPTDGRRSSEGRSRSTFDPARLRITARPNVATRVAPLAQAGHQVRMW